MPLYVNYWTPVPEITAKKRKRGLIKLENCGEFKEGEKKEIHMWSLTLKGVEDLKSKRRT